MARSSVSPADVIRHFMANCDEKGNLLDGDRVIAARSDVAAGNREAIDAVIAHMRKGDGSPSETDRAIARHFLLAGGVVLREETSSNKAGDKRAAASALLFAAAVDWPDVECRVVTLVESSAGVAFWGVESADDALALFGATRPVGPERQ